MVINKKVMAPRAMAAGLCLALAACGGGGGSSTPAAATPSNSTVSGVASKGILSSAVVKAYAISSGAKGSLLGETQTKNDGSYSLAINGYNGPLLLELTVDGDTQMTCDVPAGCANGGSTVAFGVKYAPPSTLVLQTVVAQPSGNVKTAITPFTYLAAQFALKKGGTAADVEAALSQIAALFSLSDLNRSAPVDITAADLGSDIDAQRYAVLSAAIAQMGGSSLTATLQSLVTIIKDHNGQLEKDNNTAAPSLADILAAAQTVAQSTQVSSGLSPVIGTVIASNLLEVDGQTGYTTVQPSPLAGSSDLAKAKAFVTSTHNIIQSLRGYGQPDDVLAELESRYATLKAFGDSDANPEAADVIEVANGAFSVLGETAAAASRNGLTGSFASAGIQPSFDSLEQGKRKLLAGSNLTLAIDTSAKTVTLNGTVKVQTIKHDWVCEGSPYYYCYEVITDVGAPRSYTVNNVAVKYPLAATVASSFSAELLGQGAIQGSKVRLNLQGSGPSAVTFNYASAAALASHLDAYGSSSTATAHLPENVTASLKNVVFETGTSLSNITGSFKGSLTARADKANLKVFDPTQDLRRIRMVPTQASFNGSFTGVSGDKLDAVMSVTLDGPYAESALVSPPLGHVRNGLFAYRYNSTTKEATLKLKLNPAEKLLEPWSWPYPNGEMRLRLGTPVSYDMGTCTFGMRPIEQYYEYWGYSGWSQLSCTNLTTLPAALQELNWSRGIARGYSADYLIWSLGADIKFGGLYLPKAAAGFNYGLTTEQTLAGEVVEPTEDNLSYTEDSTHFAKGAVSAKVTLHVTVNGKPLDFVADLAAQRLSYKGGNAKLVLTVNGQTITLDSPVTAGEPVFKLSDANGAAVVLLPGSDGTDSVIAVNGVEMGRIKRLSGAYIVRFLDNSLIAL